MRAHARRSSASRTCAMVFRVARLADRICPAWPRVALTTMTSLPGAGVAGEGAAGAEGLVVRMCIDAEDPRSGFRSRHRARGRDPSADCGCRLVGDWLVAHGRCRSFQPHSGRRRTTGPGKTRKLRSQPGLRGRVPDAGCGTGEHAPATGLIRRPLRWRWPDRQVWDGEPTGSRSRSPPGRSGRPWRSSGARRARRTCRP